VLPFRRKKDTLPRNSPGEGGARLSIKQDGSGGEETGCASGSVFGLECAWLPSAHTGRQESVRVAAALFGHRRGISPVVDTRLLFCHESTPSFRCFEAVIDEAPFRCKKNHVSKEISRIFPDSINQAGYFSAVQRRHWISSREGAMTQRDVATTG
jgi:hypothetical protein